MPVIKPTCIRDLKLRVNVADVIGRTVTLRKAGAQLKGLCPFHQEKSPSFNVNPDKGWYKCFGCGKAGDIISFVRETEQLNFTEAIEALGQRYNIAIEYEEGAGPTQQDRSLRQELFDLHEQATDYFAEVYRSTHPAGEFMRRYWTENRRFAPELADEFKIGVAPADDSGLAARMLKRKYSEDALRQCGLFYIREGALLTAGSIRPRFRGRLMIPIRDHQSRVVAFTARQTGITPSDDPSHEAKYVNSPETPIFTKGHLLFNLDRARSHVGEGRPFVMVEGQLDAIRCWSVGLQTAIAPQGTAITDGQLSLLRRYHPEVECFFDSDSAGQKAALRLLPLALKAGIEVRFLGTGGASKIDPDLMFLEKGIAAYGELRSGTQSAMKFACNAALHAVQERNAVQRNDAQESGLPAARALGSAVRQPDRDGNPAVQVDGNPPPPGAPAKAIGGPSAVPEVRPISSAEQKNRAAQTVLEIIAASESEVIRDEFLKEAASHLNLSVTALKGDFYRLLARRARSVSSAPAKGPVLVVATAASIAGTSEQDLLTVLLHFERIGKPLSATLPADWVDVATLPGQLLNRFLAEFEAGNWPGKDNLDSLLESAEERTLVTSLLFEPPRYEDPMKIVQEGLSKLRDRALLPRLREIELALAASLEDSKIDPNSLLTEKINLQRQLSRPLVLTAAG